MAAPKGSKMDIIGKRFGDVEVTGRASNRNGNMYFRVKCHRCGRDKEMQASTLYYTTVHSCGCARTDKLRDMRTKHGDSSSILYKRWMSMKDRIRRGRLQVDDRWLDYETFKNEVPKEGIEERRAALMQIDERHPLGPGNAVWVPFREVAARKRKGSRQITYNGVTKSMTEWASEMGMQTQLLWNRLDSGWDVERALTTPVRPRRR